MGASGHFFVAVPSRPGRRASRAAGGGEKLCATGAGWRQCWRLQQLAAVHLLRALVTYERLRRANDAGARVTFRLGGRLSARYAPLSHGQTGRARRQERGGRSRVTWAMIIIIKSINESPHVVSRLVARAVWARRWPGASHRLEAAAAPVQTCRQCFARASVTADRARSSCPQLDL